MNLEEAYAKIDIVVPSLPGWCTIEKARRLCSLVVESRAKTCVELGVFGGRSLVALGLGLAVLEDIRGFAQGVDPYAASASLEGKNAKENDDWWSKVDYADIHNQAERGISNAGVGAFTHIVVGKSLGPFMDSFAKESIDILHQDSNHSEEISCAEVLAWTSKMRPGSLWVSDDTDWETTQKSQKMLREMGFQLIEGYGPFNKMQWCVFRAPGSS
jgi:predicted O-methyltransferase YrrM